MVADVPAAERWVEISDEARRIAAEHWPGALTLVLPATERAALEVDEMLQDGTLAVRIPDHAVALGLLRGVDAPLCTSSANRAGEPAPLTADGARAALGADIDIVLDGNPGSGRPSSILDLTRPTPRLLREGGIPAERLLR
jgi:L-threonylcarbamoyladenylate synthase